MINSGTMDIHIEPYKYTNDIRVNLWLSYAIPFASWYFRKPKVRYIRILLRHSHAHYTGVLVTGFLVLFIVMFRHPCEQVTCVWLDNDGCLHTARVLGISLHCRRSKSHS